MAVAQAERVARALRGQGVRTELVKISTTGDKWTGSLAALGGKGAFTRELDAMQVEGEFEIGVHCLKDVPGDVDLPAGLEIAAYCAREDARDGIITLTGRDLDSLRPGSLVGTSSVRRTAQLARFWPGLRIEPIRGNANSRLSKLDGGGFDALILAKAGLERIGMEHRLTAVIDPERMIPAVGAGVIVLTIRTHDTGSRELIAGLDDAPTRAAALAERAMLRDLGGHCHSPIAGHASSVDGVVSLTGAVYSRDGSQMLTASGSGTDAAEVGRGVAAELLEQGAGKLIADSAV